MVREVAKRSSPVRKDGATAVLWHAMRGTSGKLHSRAKKVLSCLLDKSTICLSEKYPEGMFLYSLDMGHNLIVKQNWMSLFALTKLGLNFAVFFFKVLSLPLYLVVSAVSQSWLKHAFSGY